MGTQPITFDALLMLLGFCGIMWAIFTVYQRMTTELRETRILINILCKHAGINPEDYLQGGGK